MSIGLRQLWRDWKTGELRLLFASLLIAVATVTSISIFADRIRNSIEDQAGQLIAGDIQVRGSSPVSDQWREKARELGLSMSDILTFQAMAFSDQSMILSSVKAVSGTYPLKGTLDISTTPFVSEETVTNGPQMGEVWLASRLFGALNVTVGDTISLGDQEFKVARVVVREPDSSQSFFGVGPRIMMHRADVEATGVVQTGSRLRYSWVLAGETDRVNELVTWLEPQLGDHHRLIGTRDNDRGVSSALDRAESFLLLAGSLGVVLAGVALALAARRYAGRQISAVALLKTLGMTPSRVGYLYLVNLFVLALAGTLTGLVLGWLIHQVILSVFAGLLPENLAQAGIRPYAVGFVTGMISLLAFAAPPIWSLRQVPPARVLRSDIETGVISDLALFLIGLTATLFLVYWYSQSIMITGALMGGLLLSMFSVSAVAWLLIKLVRRFGSGFGQVFRLGFASLQRHSRQNAVQIMIFSNALMLLFILSLVRGSLINEWQQQIPDDAPNHFIYNIFDADKPVVESFIDDNNLVHSPFYPMVRGRLVDVNDQPIAELVNEHQPEDSDDYRRELNLTWSADMAPDNEIVAGQWWQPGDEDKDLISIEQSFAEGVGLKLGDNLTFSIAGQEVTAEVSSIRTVEWDSLRPNFYVIFSKPILGGSSASYMTSFRLELEQKALLNQFARELPTVSLIEVDALIEQIRSIITQVSLAVEFILLLVLVAGLLVLIASIQASVDLRLKESALIRTLGGRRSLVRGALNIEFGALGWLAGLLGVMGAELAVYFLQARVFGMEFSPHWLLWLTGPWVGMLLIGFVGSISTAKVVRVPPLVILRQV